MRFIPNKFAPIFMGIIVMPIMLTGLPLIVLLQKINFDNPQFWTIWRDTVLDVAPIGIPLALTTVAIARLLVGLFTIKPNLSS